MLFEIGNRRSLRRGYVEIIGRDFPYVLSAVAAYNEQRNVAESFGLIDNVVEQRNLGLGKFIDVPGVQTRLGTN